jgi:hypothetical protein
VKTLLIYFGSTIAGTAVAASTVYGVVSSQTTTPDSGTSGQITQESIADYGATE